MNNCMMVDILVEPEEMECACQHIRNYTFFGNVGDFIEMDKLAEFSKTDEVYKLSKYAKNKGKKYVVIGVIEHYRTFSGYYEGKLTLR